MNKKPLLILVDNQGYYSRPIIDRLEFENFAGEIVRTFNEGDTLSTLLSSTNKTPGRKHFIITDSLTASENINDDDRASGTYSMIKNIHSMFPGNKIVVYSTDFFNLDRKLTKGEVEFMYTHPEESYNNLIKMIHEYAK